MIGVVLASIQTDEDAVKDVACIFDADSAISKCNELIRSSLRSCLTDVMYDEYVRWYDSGSRQRTRKESMAILYALEFCNYAWYILRKINQLRLCTSLVKVFVTHDEIAQLRRRKSECLLSAQVLDSLDVLDIDVVEEADAAAGRAVAYQMFSYAKDERNRFYAAKLCVDRSDGDNVFRHGVLVKPHGEVCSVRLE